MLLVIFFICKTATYFLFTTFAGRFLYKKCSYNEFFVTSQRFALYTKYFNDIIIFPQMSTFRVAIIYPMNSLCSIT